MDDALRRLAEVYGVETGYKDMDGRWRDASPDVLIGALQTLGAEIDSIEDAGSALRAAYAERLAALVEPCQVIWHGEPVGVGLTATAGRAGTIEWSLSAGDGSERAGSCELAELAVASTEQLRDQQVVRRWLPLGPPLLSGYHRLTVTIAGERHASWLLVAPPRAYRGPGELRSWGLFAPTYALRSSVDRGIGDLGHLRELASWAGQLGAEFIGTLPLLACQPGQISPYSPSSRRAWNHVFVDMRDEALAVLGLPPGGIAHSVSRPDLVDYAEVHARLDSALDKLARHIFDQQPLAARVEAWAEKHPRAEDFARYSAVRRAHGQSWQSWPEAERAGNLDNAAYDVADMRRALVGQWLMSEQLGALSASDGPGLYLDLPVGVDGGGYDVWRERDAFAMGFTVGAPPDPLCLDGQNWGLPPLDPRAMRLAGHRYLAECIGFHAERAAMLRVDHVMGLHRLFWVPDGGSAADGVYVRYPAAEQYAVLCIESHRHRCAVAGEDLGTVPDDVRPAMDSRGLHRLFVGQFDWDWQDGRPALRPPAPGSVASLGTHDTATFAVFAEREGFADQAGQVMLEWHRDMAESSADVALITVEDLWLEREPQNVPGTTDEQQPNWRRRMKLDLAELTGDRGIATALATVAEHRKNRAR